MEDTRMTRRSSPAELIAQRAWANLGALLLLIGGLLLVGGQGVAMRIFALFVLGQGARALWVGVELQIGDEPDGRRPLARSLLLTGAVLSAFGVARLMGTL